MFDDDGAIQALTAQAQLNQPTQPKEPTLFQGSWAAVAKIIPAAAGETIRAFNQMATPAAMTEEKKSRLAEKFGADFAEYEAARRAEAIQEHDEVGSSLGRFVKSMTPDAQSSGTAAQIIHGIGKTVGKAVGYSAAGGLPGIAIGLSTDEGINESLRLQDAGVDQATANQAGVVRAATTAVSVALPGAGPTLAKTIGLVATAGPAAFMADQAAIRHILESANYADKAKEYDPYDLTNLLISSVPGAVIGGIHLRGRTKAGAGEAATPEASPAVAKEEVNVQNDSAGITAAADQEAAARVMQVDEHMQSKALTPPDDLVGQMNHQKAMDLATRQLDEGTPLDVQGVVRADLAAARFAEVSDVAPTSARVTDTGENVATMGENVARTGDTVVRVDENGTSSGNLVQQDLPPSGEPRPATLSVEQISRVIDEKIDDAHLDQPIVIAKADDGTPITTTGRELLEDVRNQQVQADNDSKSFIAAIECFISSGDMV